MATIGDEMFRKSKYQDGEEGRQIANVYEGGPVEASPITITSNGERISTALMEASRKQSAIDTAVARFAEDVIKVLDLPYAIFTPTSAASGNRYKTAKQFIADVAAAKEALVAESDRKKLEQLRSQANSSPVDDGLFKKEMP